MKLKTPINENYAAMVVRVSTLIPLENCQNVQHANIFGNLVIVGKDLKVGDYGIYFPVETQLSETYLYENNLYRDSTKNRITTEKGYFEENGRIRCMKFRGHRSEGLLMPLSSVTWFLPSIGEVAELFDEGATFDELGGIPVCQKYVVKVEKTPGAPGSKSGRITPKKVSRLAENQFRFHSDTSMLGKNMHRITPETMLQISNKLHGSSFVTAKLIVNKKLSWFSRLLITLGVDIIDQEYDTIYSSRKVIKNDDLNKDYSHYYKEDIWADVTERLKPFLQAGLSFYGEVVGYTNGGAAIQRGYDYGKLPPNLESRTDEEHLYGWDAYIYRITFTNVDGKVYEFTARQVKDWCAQNGLKAVPEYFYGKAKELVPDFVEDKELNSFKVKNEEAWRGELLEFLLQAYNMEKDCELCKNKVPAEGIVVRLDSLEYEAYKLKAFAFRERETKLLDEGESDIESQESQTEE